MQRLSEKVRTLKKGNEFEKVEAEVLEEIAL